MILRNDCLFAYMNDEESRHVYGVKRRNGVQRNAPRKRTTANIYSIKIVVMWDPTKPHFDNTNTDETIRTKLKPNTNCRTKWKFDQSTVMDVAKQNETLLILTL